MANLYVKVSVDPMAIVLSFGRLANLLNEAHAMVSHMLKKIEKAFRTSILLPSSGSTCCILNVLFAIFCQFTKSHGFSPLSLTSVSSSCLTVIFFQSGQKNQKKRTGINLCCAILLHDLRISESKKLPFLD